MGRKILVAYDTSLLSRKAIDEAKTQAKLVEDSHLYIVTVVTPGITSNSTAASGNLSMNDAELIYPKLEEIKKELQGNGFNVHTEIITDFSQRNPGVAICDYVEEHAIDMVVVGHRGLSNLKRLFLGSVSSTIVQRAASKVLVIK
ncbi:universal stress protein [Oceanobacillus indicireducens]|uniref:Universal stress protein UspA n=1 Tax=Oceanobacillus indicireducens TaxID=1004261 RepID=A0A917XS08_9BACI|nr:universal stress protein [Oceanobacillus indicireducens]GGN51283.1 universal stress protein UspA [Oceanobacillus indicireducens]